MNKTTIKLLLPIILLLLFSGVASANNFTEIANVTSSNDFLESAVIDSTNTYAYFGSRDPSGKIVKIQLSDFTEIANITSSINDFKSAVIDSTNTYAYFFTATSPSKVVKIQLSDFTEVTTLTLSVNNIRSAVIDSTNTFIYAGNRAVPSKVVKIRLSNFTEVTTLLLSVNDLESLVIDSADSFIYAGTDTIPAKISKIQLSNFTEVATLTSAERYFDVAVIDSTNTYAYFFTATSPSKVVKIQLSDFTEVTTLTLSVNNVYTAIINPTDLFIYSATTTSPAKLNKIQLSDFTEIANITLSVNVISSAVIDSTNTYAYLGTSTDPAKIVKVDISQASPIINYDPSGYVNDTNGVALFNAKVTLSNATFNVTDYTDAIGYWNVDIYSNNTYNYNVSLNGYTTLSGSQAFVMGGTDYNFTMSAGKGRVYGTIYEWTNESGSKSIVGDLKSLKQIFKTQTKYKIYLGSTLTLPAPDTKTYVLKNKDVDVSGNTALISVLLNGVEMFLPDCGATFCTVEENKDYRYKLSETATTELYMVLKVSTIFSGSGDTSFIEVTPSYDVRQKSTTSDWDIIYFWQTYFNSGSVGVVSFFIDVINWLSFTPGNPDTKVTFNASTGNDAEAETVMDFSSDTSLTTYSVTIRTANLGGAGKIGYGFTDDDIETPPNYKDITIQTGNNEYGTADYRKFSDTDTDGDKKIKVWLYFYTGYGSKWDFNYFVTAFCTGCNLKPLADALVYQSYNNNTKSNAIGFYNLYVPFGTYNISFSKDGHESKSISFTFNAANNVNNTDVTINKSTTNITEPVHYVKVLPDPSNQGTAISAYYKTLNTYSYYKISICPFNDDANCLDSYDSDFGVAPNKESFVALKTYPIGTYSVYLSGKNFFDWSWSIAAVNNFTIISTIPVANWEASTYYLGDTMKINVYVPSGSQNLTVYYPNGTVWFTGMFSAATTIQNKTFATNNLSTPGKYITEITGNSNKSVTELLNILAGNYSLFAPVSVTWGKSFTVQYISPKTSELIILKSDGSPAYTSKTVTGSKSASFNTSSLENKADTLTVKLIQNNVEKAKITISIGAKTSSDPGEATTNFWINLLSFLGMPAFWGLFLFCTVIYTVATNEKAAPSLGIVAFIVANIEAIIGLWAPFTMYILLVAWIIAGITFTLGRKTTTGA